MQHTEYLQLKENVTHGNPDLPMEIYKGEFNNNSNFYPHWHNEIELLYIVDGSGVICLDLTFHNFNSGDLILIPKGTLHYMSETITNNISYNAIVFDLSILQNSTLDFCQVNFINPLYNNELQVKNLITKSDSGYDDILHYFKILTEIYEKKDFAFQLELKGTFLLMFHKLLKKDYIKKTDCNTPNEKIKVEKIKEVITYIQENYKKSISIKELSEIAKYSDYHFVRFFKSQTGKTCTEFINSFRIQKSIEFLLNTNLPITEIAYEVGFGDVSYFIKTFKKLIGTSPSIYRKNV